MERLLLKENWGGATARRRFCRQGLRVRSSRRGWASTRARRRPRRPSPRCRPRCATDPSYIFSRALYSAPRQEIRGGRQGHRQGARATLNLLVDGDEWWAERRLVTRELLDKGDSRRPPMRSRATMAPNPRRSRSRPSSIAGWIALRFLNDPAAAARHFATVAQTGSTPISPARVAYWQGRAAEAAGRRRGRRAASMRAAAEQPDDLLRPARPRKTRPDLSRCARCEPLHGRRAQGLRRARTRCRR